MITLALVTGGFDPLHSGHIAYFNAAKELGDSLCVAVNSNDWLIRKKGKYFMTAPERISIIQELRMVDACIEFNDKDDTANDAIKMALEVYDNIIFANGGDRGNTNTPEYEEFKDAESQLQLELKKVQAELEKIAVKLDSLNQDYEVKRLMALDKGESIRKEMEQLELQGRKFQQEQFDPQNGQLMRKQAQMEFKILGKVKEAVQKVAIDSGFDYVMDASIGLLYVKPKFDITDEVLHELRNLTKDN